MNNIELQINKSGLKKIYIAKKLGITNQTISNWVIGKYSPTLLQAQKLKEILGLDSIDELIEKDK